MPVSAWRRFFLLLLALLVTACSSSSEPPLRVGTNLWLGYEPLYLARDIGSLPPEAIRLVEMPSTTDVLHALRARTLEAAALTLDEVIALRAEGLDLQVALVLDFSSGADALIARPALGAVNALAGRRIGYEESAVGAVILNAALEAAGLTPAQVELVALTPDEHVSAYLDGRVDAVVTYEPARSRLLEAGGHLLFDSRQIPGEIVDVLAVRADIAARQARRLSLLRNGWFAALEYLRHYPVAAREAMALRHQRTPDQLTSGFDGIRLAGVDVNRELLAGQPPLLRGNASALAELMMGAGLLARVPDLAGLVLRFGSDP